MFLCFFFLFFFFLVLFFICMLSFLSKAFLLISATFHYTEINAGGRIYFTVVSFILSGHL